MDAPDVAMTAGRLVQTASAVADSDPDMFKI